MVGWFCDQISFPKPDRDYNPGQVVQIEVPSISVFEFHPISLSSVHEKTATLHMREIGDWTSKLLALVRDDPTATAQILMEGPYGALSVDLDDDKRYKMAICVSGGIGVTPCQSIGKSLRLGTPTQELQFCGRCDKINVSDLTARFS